MPDSSVDRDPLDRLAEEFVARFRAGERPALTEYTRRLPGREDEVRELFPALVELEQVKPAAADATGPHNGSVDPPLDHLGEFRIIRQVGKGGMGVVYEAVQESLGRHVALKVLPTHAFSDPVRLERFRREAKAAARLHHTNIVPVFGTGEADGRHYYAMQFIRGHALDAVIEEVRRLNLHAMPTRESGAASEVARAMLTGSFRPADATEVDATLPPAPGRPFSGSLSEGGRHYLHAVARLGIQVAEALAYAHEQGVVHRDIKPSNLLLDWHGTTWVADFGLAKGNEDADLTSTGDIVGTLRYMAPERFENQGDHRADVYALGLTLYGLLTHQPAFCGDSKPKLIEQVVTANPTRPRALNPAIPRDLETIVLKAIARDPAMRYQSARDMAEDLKRYDEDRPILARRASTAEQAWRWCRRNPLVAALIVAVLATTSVGAVAATLFALSADANARQAKTEAAAVEAAQVDLSRSLADSYGGQGLAARDQDRPAEAAVWFAEAAKQLYPGDATRETTNRGWVRAWLSECFVPIRALPAGPPITQVALSPTGRYLIARFNSGPKSRVTVTDLTTETAWSVPEGFADLIGAAWSPNGTAIALGTRDQKAGVFAFPSGKPMVTWETGSAAPAVGFSSDGSRVAIGGSSVRVWDLTAGKAIGPDRPHPGVAVEVEFAADGTKLLTWAIDGKARLYPLTDDAAAEPTITTAHRGGFCPRFADSGRLLIVQSTPGTLSGLDTTTGQDRFTQGKVFSLAHIAVTQDGQSLWTAEGDRFKRWSLSDPGPLPQWKFFSPREKQINSIAVSANGWVAAAGADRKVELYSPDHNQPFPALLHAVNVRLVGISADASTLVTVQEDGLARVWTVPHSPPVREVGSGTNPRFARFSPTGRFIVPSGGTFGGRNLTRVQVYDSSTLAEAAPAVEPGTVVSDVDISPDECLLATVASPASTRAQRQSLLSSPANDAVRFWAVTSGQAVGKSLTTPSEPRAVRFHPSGKQVAVVCAGGEVMLIDPMGPEVLQTTPRRPGTPEGFLHYCNNGKLRYSTDGSRLYLYGFTWGIAAIDPATGKDLYTVSLGKNFDLQPSPDGTVLAVSCQSSMVRFLDATSGQEAAPALGHPDWVFSARFSPDGTRLLTACRDGAARIWDWRSGQLRAVLNHGDQVSGGGVKYGDEVTGAEFTMDGRLAISVGCDMTVRTWDTQTGRPAVPPIRLDQQIHALDLAPNGQAILAGGIRGGKIRRIDLASLAQPDDRTAEDLLLLAEAVAGERLAPNGALVRLTTPEWRQRFEECRRRGLVPSPR